MPLGLVKTTFLRHHSTVL